MGKVTVELTGDEIKLLKAFDRVMKKERELAAAAEDTGKKSEKSSKKAKDGFKGLEEQLSKTFGAQGAKMITSFTKGLIGAGGVATAIATIRKEVQELYAVHEEAANAQISVDAAYQDLINNIGALSRDSQNQVLAAVKQISIDAGVSEGVIAKAMESAVSASGGNIEASISAVTQAAKNYGYAPEKIGEFSGSLLDMMSITGSDDAEVNQGFLQTVGLMSRITDPTKAAKHGAQAMTGAVKYGATAEEAGALFSAITTSTKDIEGPASATTTVSLAQQLDEFFEEKGLTKKHGEMSLGARIDFLQENSKLGKKFIEGASFERKSSGSMRELILDDQSETARMFDENLSKMGTPEEQKSLAQDTLKQREMSPYYKTGLMQRRFDVLQEQAELMDAGSLDAIAHKEITEAEYKDHVTRPGRAMNSFQRWMDAQFGGNEVEDSPKYLRKMAERRQDPFMDALAAGAGPMGILSNYLDSKRDRTEEERQRMRHAADNIEIINKIDSEGLLTDLNDSMSGLQVSIEKMVELQQRQIGETQKQTETIKTAGTNRIVNRNANR